jgi:hypothetical protein
MSGTEKQRLTRQRNHEIMRLRGIPVSLFCPEDQKLVSDALDRALKARGARTQREHQEHHLRESGCEEEFIQEMMRYRYG